VLLSLVYRLLRGLFGLLAVLVRSDLSKDVELLVLRHENQVLRRQAGGRPRWDHTDRLWLTALSRLVSRCRWAEIFPVTPATILRWHRSLVARKWCAVPKRRTLSPSWAFATRSGSSAVLVDQPGDGLSTVDLGSHVDHIVGIVQRRAERAALMRPVIVEVSFILGKDRPQMPFPIDQQVIEALAA
jgi:hypothetical protein